MALEEPGRWACQLVSPFRRQSELRLHPLLEPERGPVVAPRVAMRRGADVVVAVPAEARTALAVRLREHASKGGEVDAALEVEEFHQQVGAPRGDAVRARLGGAVARRAQAGEAVGFGREGVLEGGGVALQEQGLALDPDAVALVDAAAGDPGGGLDTELALEVFVHPEVSLVLARLRRSTSMPMNARSNLLRQSAEARSRSATPMRTMREGLLAVRSEERRVGKECRSRWAA